MKPKIVSGKSLLIQKASSTVFVALIVGSVAIALTGVLLKFLWGVKSFNDKVIDGKTDARNVLKENVSNLDELKRNYATLEASEQVNPQIVLDALPSAFDFPALATSIESLALQSSVNIESFTGEDLTGASSSEANPQPVEIPITIVMNGNYNNIQSFLDKLDRTIRPMKVTKLLLSGEQNNIQATIDLTTYYQPGQSIEVEMRTIE